METINLTINGKAVSVPAGSTILEAARAMDIDIPTLCYMKEINEIGACRICVVEVVGAKNLAAACVTPVTEGMVVYTNSEKVIDSRRNILELILSTHERRCLSCVRSGQCELQDLCRQCGIQDEAALDGDRAIYEIDDSAIHMVRDNNKCVLCRKCTAVCEKVQGIGVIAAQQRGVETYIGSAFGRGLGDTSCVGCGQCIAVCPVGAIYEKDSTEAVFDAINDPDKYVVVEAAPAVRAALGEEFGFPIGTDVEGKMATALRKLGFDGVFDTNFGADLTIMEEANELIDRIQNGGKLPLITSCSPGWVKYCEHYFPEMTDNLSSCKSPQQMFGAIAKSYYAEKMGIDKNNMVVVSVMPCTAKKIECSREELSVDGVYDVDYSITTRELARMIKRVGIRFADLEDGEFDMPLGLGTGAAVIFGATGGVMEAALRTAVEKLTGETLPAPEFKDVRGIEGIKEASYDVAGMNINVAVASGLINARKLLEKVKSGEADYQFIEIMGCPGGCVNGGGQPQQPGNVRNFTDIRAKRASVLYSIDEKNTIRKSHENPAIIELYDTYLGEPGSEKAHHLLHTHYIKRGLNNGEMDLS